MEKLVKCLVIFCILLTSGCVKSDKNNQDKIDVSKIQQSAFKIRDCIQNTIKEIDLINSTVSENSNLDLNMLESAIIEKEDFVTLISNKLYDEYKDKVAVHDGMKSMEQKDKCVFEDYYELISDEYAMKIVLEHNIDKNNQKLNSSSASIYLHMKAFDFEKQKFYVDLFSNYINKETCENIFTFDSNDVRKQFNTKDRVMYMKLEDDVLKMNFPISKVKESDVLNKFNNIPSISENIDIKAIFKENTIGSLELSDVNEKNEYFSKVVSAYADCINKNLKSNKMVEPYVVSNVKEYYMTYDMLEEFKQTTVISLTEEPTNTITIDLVGRIGCDMKELRNIELKINFDMLEGFNLKEIFIDYLKKFSSESTNCDVTPTKKFSTGYLYYSYDKLHFSGKYVLKNMTEFDIADDPVIELYLWGTNYSNKLLHKFEMVVEEWQ